MQQILRRISLIGAIAVLTAAGALVDVPLRTSSAAAESCRDGRTRCRRPTRRPAPRRRTAIDRQGGSGAGALPIETRPGVSRSHSVGRASRGRLLFGVPLADTPYLAVRRGTHFGTAELVALIDHAARTVSAAFPGSRLSVGDLSREGGGRLRPHRSHRTGRDADIAFYMLDGEGRPAFPGRFVRVSRDGEVAEEGLHFDGARNWAFLRAMLEYPGAQLQYVFVSPPVRDRLLEEGARAGASQELLDRAAEVMSHQARGHDNHYHVRIHCPAGDDACEDREPPRRHRHRGHHRGRVRVSPAAIDV